MIGAFILLGIAGLIVMGAARYTGESMGNEVVVWGTIEPQVWSEFQKKVEAKIGSKKFRVKYVRKQAAAFEAEVVEALATDAGPDLFFLSQEKILRMKNKIYVIPYANYPARLFRDTFIEEGELYLTKEGILGFPFEIDPLVLYWNRDIFSSAGVAVPPKFWDELFELSQKITRKESDGDIVRSAIALGEFDNITHAKDIISAIIMQSGSPIVKEADIGAGYHAALSAQGGTDSTATESAVRFYTEFANPIKSTYTWNRALSPSIDAFIAGDVAMYVGYASELSELRKKNPNLNFDVASLPQVRDQDRERTFGKMKALVVAKASRFVADAFNAATKMTSKEVLDIWHGTSMLPPVRRDMLITPSNDAFRSIFFDGALIAHGWLDPDSKETDETFREMISSVTTGRSRISEAVSRANLSLAQLLAQYDVK